MNKLTTIKSRMLDMIGISLLSQSSKQFIFTHFNLILFYTIPGMFINTFFFNQSGNIKTIAIFQMITAVGLALVMHLSSLISAKTSSAFIMRIGIIFFNIFYILLLVLQTNAFHFVIILGVINALANGFYWQGYNEMLQYVTNDENYDRTASMLGLVTSIVNLIIPTLSGYVIVLCPNKSIGYTVIFALSFAFSIYTTYILFKLEKYKTNTESSILKMYHYIFTNKIAFSACLGEFFRGIRNLSFPLFLSIVFYRQVMNEGYLGINNTLAGLASIISFIVASKVLKPKNRIFGVFITAVILTITFLSFFLTDSFILVFILTIINAALVAFIDNPIMGIFYNMFKNEEDGINFNLLMSGREMFYGIGRACGVLMVIFLSNSKLELAIFSLIANSAIFITLILFNYSLKLYQNREKKEII